MCVYLYVRQPDSYTVGQVSFKEMNDTFHLFWNVWREIEFMEFQLSSNS